MNISKTRYIPQFWLSGYYITHYDLQNAKTVSPGSVALLADPVLEIGLRSVTANCAALGPDGSVKIRRLRAFWTLCPTIHTDRLAVLLERCTTDRRLIL